MFNFLNLLKVFLVIMFLLFPFTSAFSKENNYSLKRIKELAVKFLKNFNLEAIDKIYNLLSQQEVVMGSRFTSTIPVLMPTGTVFYSHSENSILIATKMKNSVINNVELLSEDGGVLFSVKDTSFSKRSFIFYPKLKGGKEYTIKVVALYLSPDKEVKETKKRDFVVITPAFNKNLAFLEKKLESIDAMKLAKKEKFLLKAIVFEDFSLKTGGLYDFSYNRDKYIYLFKNTN